MRERDGDPARALIAFISNSGFDPTLVRKREATELAAFGNFVRFVCQVEESTDLVSARQRTLLDRYTYYGEHPAARSLLDLFVTLNEAGNLFERSPGPYRFAAFAMHTRTVAALRESAVLADLAEAKALLETSRRYARLTWRFRNTAERKETIEAAVGEQGESLSPHDRAVWAGLLSGLARTRGGLTDDADCDVLKELESFEARVESLAGLLDDVAARNAAAARRAAEERRRREEEARRQQEQQKKKKENEGGPRQDFKGREARDLSQEELLQIFGFPPGASLELRALRRAFIREASKTHPVSGQPDYRERNERLRILKDAYERLKIAIG